MSTCINNTSVEMRKRQNKLIYICKVLFCCDSIHLEGAVFFLLLSLGHTEWVLITCRHSLCPRCQFHLCNQQTTNWQPHALVPCQTYLNIPPNSYCVLISAQHAIVTKPILLNGAWTNLVPSANRFVVFTPDFSKAMCLPESSSALTFFSLCVLRADVKVSVSPTRKSSRYDATNPSADPQQRLFTLVVLWTEKPWCSCENATATVLELQFRVKKPLVTKATCINLTTQIL